MNRDGLPSPMVLRGCLARAIRPRLRTWAPSTVPARFFPMPLMVAALPVLPVLLVVPVLSLSPLLPVLPVAWAASPPTPYPGTIVTLDSPPPLYLADSFTYTESGPPLLFSDQPEYVRGEGILARGTFAPGAWRLFVYHVNQDSGLAKYFPVVVRNLSDKDVTVVVHREGVRGPSTGYNWVGQEALRAFLLSNQPRRIVIPAGGWALLDPVGLSRPVGENQLIEGLYEGEVDGPVEMLVLATNGLDDLEPDRFQPYEVDPGKNMRGTFPSADRYVELEWKGGEEQGIWLFASGKYYDPFQVGRDELDGNTRMNFGNYGVIYHITLRLRSEERQRVRVLFGSGSGCGFAGAVRITAGPQPGRVVRIPETPRRTFPGYGREMSFLAQFELEPGEEVVYGFDFMPPGASCLPALLVVDPLPQETEQ